MLVGWVNGLPAQLKHPDLCQLRQVNGAMSHLEIGADVFGQPPLGSNGDPLVPVDLEAARSTATTSSTRLEGLILRSQLLVLLQRRHFCDAQVR